MSERTRTTRTFQGPGGSNVVRMYGAAVNYRDDGRWRLIDNKLVPEGSRRYALRNAANRFRVRLPRDLGSTSVRIDDGNRWLSFRLLGADGAPSVVSGASAARYQATGSVGVEYLVTADGLKENLILRDAAAPATFAYELRLARGLKPRSATATDIDVRDRDGRVAFRLSAPLMYDARGVVEGRSTALRLGVRRADRGTWRVTLTIDGAWLRAPDRRFPVTVDPTTYVGRAGAQDCLIAGADYVNTKLCGQNYVDIGWDGYEWAAAGAPHRGMFRFDPASVIPAGATILSARFGLMLWGGYRDDVPLGIALHRLTRNWTTEATWRTFDGITPWTQPGGDFAAAAETVNPSVQMPLAYHYWSISELVQQWVSGTTANYGFLLKAVSESGNVNTIKTMASGNGNYPDEVPYLEVSYELGLGRKRHYSYVTEELGIDLDARVNLGNGNLSVHEDDLQLQAAVLDLRVDRYYNSLSPETGPLGRGWNLGDVGVRLEAIPNGDRVYYDATGARARYALQSDGTYRRPYGTPATLVAIAGGGHELTLTTTRETLTFDSGGRLIKDYRDDHAADIAYDTAGRLASITDLDPRGDDDGRSVVAYDAAGNVSSVTAPNRSAATYTVEGGYLKQRTARGQTTTYGYGSNGKLSRVQAPAGTLKFGYDAQNRVTSVTRVTDAATDSGPTTRIVYPSADTTVVTRHDGTLTTYRYDRDLQGHTPDTTPPVIEEPDPGEDVVVNAAQSSVQIDAEVTDDATGVRTVRLTRADGTLAAERAGICRRAGGAIDVCERYLDADLTVPTATLAVGGHAFTLRATDAAGRESTRAVTVVVDRTAPSAPDDVDIVAVDATATTATLGIDPGEDADALDGRPRRASRTASCAGGARGPRSPVG